MMPYVVVLVFALFQLIGGVAFGASLRQLYAAVSEADAELRSAALKQAMGSLVFGLIFGGIVTLTSAAWFFTLNRPFFLAGLAVLVAAALGSLFLPRTFLQEIGAGTLAGLGIGLLVVPMGVLVGIEGFRKGDPGFGLLWGGCAGFVGLAFLLGSLGALLSGKALVLHQTGPGSYELMPAEQAAAIDEAAAADDAADAESDSGFKPLPAKPARRHHH